MILVEVIGQFFIVVMNAIKQLSVATIKVVAGVFQHKPKFAVGDVVMINYGRHDAWQDSQSIKQEILEIGANSYRTRMFREKNGASCEFAISFEDESIYRKIKL